MEHNKEDCLILASHASEHVLTINNHFQSENAKDIDPKLKENLKVLEEWVHFLRTHFCDHRD